ncbi:carboxymuconolactone decarboxylase family protein [Pseudomonas sp. TH41]|uniref:carboxymuconolactone decarboxylase family protein n=1 Tax=Pseudomonas sp. TH41 TaxID=2796405 RepID=UPI001912010C|nr:carboxymuconolactone decarboxylase family protein [Pseudomonas sp. TH41]MBK5351061.1 carboxymuconolactone decarboxylase family protein [Pseudomonas sp. TH41]
MNDDQTKPGTPTCDAMRDSGNWNHAWDPLAELDAEWMEKFVGMATHPIRKGILDPKTFELIAIAVDASCTHMYAPGVRRHIRKALELGVSVEEILAVLQLTTILGIHSMALGAPILIEEAQKLAVDGPVKGTF